MSPELLVIRQSSAQLAPLILRANHRENRQTRVCEEALWRMKRIAERRVEIATTVSETEFAANCNCWREKKTFLEASCVDKGQKRMSKTLP